jgi:hypothetical protein
MGTTPPGDGPPPMVARARPLDYLAHQHSSGAESERQRLYTAVDSAAIVGACYLAAYAADTNALTFVTNRVTGYLTDYRYVSGGLSGCGKRLSVTQPAATSRTLHVIASWTRPTMLLNLIGLPMLSTTARTTAPASRSS